MPLKKSSICFYVLILAMLLQGYKPVEKKNKIFRSLADKTELFKQVGCEYSNKLTVKNPRFFAMNPHKKAFYDLDKQQLDEYSKKYSQAVAKEQNAPMYVKWVSEKVGYGVFADRDIREGDFLGEYVGELRLVNNDADDEDLDYAWFYTLDAPDSRKLVIDGKKQGNELRFINHSPNPNTAKIDVLGEDGAFHICYIAIKDIKKGRQLTVSYGDEYWTSREIDPELFG